MSWGPWPSWGRVCLRNRAGFLEDLGRVPVKELRVRLGEAVQRWGAERPEVVAAKGVVYACAIVYPCALLEGIAD